MSHPSPEMLNAFRVGNLTQEELDAIASHVEQCEQCSQALLFDTSRDQLEDELAGLGPWQSLLRRSPTSEVPDVLIDHPRYEVIRPLGNGGMGRVFLARHKMMDRLVAIKIVHPELMVSSRGRSRFLREVKAISKLSHANIAVALDADREQSTMLLVMEYIEGIDLQQMVREQGPLPFKLAVYIACEVARGLRYAWKQGIVHRDIKPANIMIDQAAKVKILDFGLASFRERGTDEETLSGMILGTPEYMSPEQATDSKSVDFRADEYSLGCTLYFLLTGRPVFDYESSAQLIAVHLQELPRPPKEINPEIPVALSNIILRMLSKSPEQRFGDYRELITNLLPFAEDPTVFDSSFSTLGQTSPTLDTSQQTTCAAEHGKTPSLPARYQPGVSRRWYLMGLGLTAAILAMTAWGVFAIWGPEKRTPKVLVVVPFDSYYTGDYERVVSRLRAVGIPYTTASSQLGVATEYPELPAESPAIVDVALDMNSVRKLDYDFVIFTGAYPIEYLEFAHEKRDVATVLIDQVLRQGGMIGAVCGAIDVLAAAKLLTGKRAAKAEYIRAETRDDMRIAWVENQAVVAADEHQQIFTSLRSEDAGRLVESMLAAYYER